MAKEAKGGFTPPEDMTRLDVPDPDGWWACEKGNPVYGRLIGWFPINDPKKGLRDVALVKLGEAIKATDNKKNPITLAKGQIAAVGVRHKLADIMRYVDSKAIVYINPTVKKDIGGGQTLWQFDLRIKGEASAPPFGSAASGAQASGAQASKTARNVDGPGDGPGDDDDIPF